MSVEARQVREITEQVWESVLMTALDPVDVDGEDPFAGHAVTGCVQVTGAWEGAITISCTPNLARNAAATMFELGATPPSDDEVRDALGELANVVGGNVKALLPGTTHLSLPIVATGDRRTLAVIASETVCTLRFAWEGEPVEVTVLARAHHSARLRIPANHEREGTHS